MRSARVATAAVGALALAVSACNDPPSSGTQAAVAVVRVSAQPCDRPTSRHGVGTVVAPGLVLTAAHVVDGPTRELEVDGVPARVVAVDAALDAALVTAPVDGWEHVDVASGDGRDDSTSVVTPDGVIAAPVVRRVTLVVDDVTERTRDRRPAIVLRGAVPAGTSGAPVVDTAGRVVGIVTLVDRAGDVTYATASEAFSTVVDSHRSGWGARAALDPSSRCS